MTSEPAKQRIATKALIMRDNQILLVREAKKYEEGSRHGSYDFPGGRIEPGELWKDGLLREVREETGLTDITIKEPVAIDEWFPTIRNIPHHIVGLFIRCEAPTGDVILGEEHDDFQWITPNDLEKLTIHPQAKTVLKQFWQIA
jgi:ADP-ribose pyrophosphatase YjhB (NUDIX family)